MRLAAEYVGYRAVKWLLGRLPLWAVRRLGRAAGRLYYLTGRGHREVALANLEGVFPGECARQRAIARDCFASYGAIFFESLHAYGRDPGRFRQRFDLAGVEHLKAAAAMGRGCLIVTGHYGNWELALWPLGHLLERVHIVARPLANPRIDRDVAALRARLGHELLQPKSAGFRMLKTLRRGGNVAVVFDQRVQPRNGILLPVLGRNAWITPMVAALSISTGAPVVPVFCTPEGADRYRVVVLPPILPEGKGYEAEAAMTRRYLEPLEQRIRERPGLWLWMHRLWRLTQFDRRPDLVAQNRRVSGLGADAEPDASDLDPRVRVLAGGAFMEDATNAIIVATSESGKRAPRAVAGALFRRGHRVRYAEARALARELAAAGERSELDRSYRELDVCDLVVVDGLGGEPLSAAEADALIALFEQRRGRRSTLVGTAIPVDDWARVFRDAIRAQAARQAVVEGSRQFALS